MARFPLARSGDPAGLKDHPVPTRLEAGFVTRAIAFTLDAAIVTIAFAVAGVIVGLLTSLFVNVQIKSLTAVIGAVATWAGFVSLYFVLFWTVGGQTPGMRIMGLRVLTVRGNPPHLIRAAIRGIALALLFLFTPLVLITRRRQGLHDKVAGTVVVYVEAELEAEALRAELEAVASEGGSSSIPSLPSA